MSGRSAAEVLHDAADLAFLAAFPVTVARGGWRCGCQVWHRDCRPIARAHCCGCGQAALIIAEAL